MVNIDQVRKNFPYLSTGEIYFNHASLGPLSQNVVNRLNNFIYQRSVNPIDNFETFMQSSRSAKEKLSIILNCKPERIAWINNVSDGLSMLAQSLNLAAGDRIILFEGEFPSNIYPFMNLQQNGVQIDFIKTRNGKIDLQDIAEKITAQTKLLSISAVQFLSGYRSNLQEIGKLCNDNDIIFCVDAIQAAGVVELDIVKYKVDFLIGGAQKWLMGLQGTSYFYISIDLQEKLIQKNVGWTSVKDAWNLTSYNLQLKDDATRFQNVTLNTIGITALDESLNMFTALGISNISELIIQNTLHFRDRLNEIGVNLYLNDTNTEELSGIITIIIDNPLIVFDNLSAAKIRCSLRDGLIRFAPHFYNTEEEIDRVVKVIKEITF